MLASLHYILRLSNPVWSINVPTALMVFSDGKWIAVFLSCNAKIAKQMANIILSKESSNNELKSYFEAVLKLSQSDNQFPINLEDVWMLAYSEKCVAVRALKKNFIENIDFQPLDQNVKRSESGKFNGENKVEYMLSTSCLEYFIARKVRPVFEVYRQVFHKAVQKETLFKESEIKSYLLQADQVAREAVKRAEIAERQVKKLEEQIWEEKARVVIETERMALERNLKNSCFGYLIQTKQYTKWQEYDMRAKLKQTTERLKREQKKKDARPYELPF